MTTLPGWYWVDVTAQDVLDRIDRFLDEHRDVARVCHVLLEDYNLSEYFVADAARDLPERALQWVNGEELFGKPGLWKEPGPTWEYVGQMSLRWAEIGALIDIIGWLYRVKPDVLEDAGELNAEREEAE